MKAVGKKVTAVARRLWGEIPVNLSYRVWKEVATGIHEKICSKEEKRRDYVLFSLDKFLDIDNWRF